MYSYKSVRENRGSEGMAKNDSFLMKEIGSGEFEHRIRRSDACPVEEGS